MLTDIVEGTWVMLHNWFDSIAGNSKNHHNQLRQVDKIPILHKLASLRIETTTTDNLTATCYSANLTIILIRKPGFFPPSLWPLDIGNNSKYNYNCNLTLAIRHRTPSEYSVSHSNWDTHTSNSTIWQEHHELTATCCLSSNSLNKTIW